MKLKLFHEVSQLCEHPLGDGASFAARAAEQTHCVRRRCFSRLFSHRDPNNPREDTIIYISARNIRLTDNVSVCAHTHTPHCLRAPAPLALCSALGSALLCSALLGYSLFWSVHHTITCTNVNFVKSYMCPQPPWQIS